MARAAFNRMARSPTATAGPRRGTGGARERIVRTAHDLFVRHGMAAVGVDRIVEEAGVSKTTLYRHFRGKEQLVLAVLDLRERLWAVEWLEAEVTRRARTPRARLLAIFDAFDDWFRTADYEGCLFTDALLESHDRKSAVAAMSIEKRAHVRLWVRGLAEAAGIAEPDPFAAQWQMLMTGALIAAGEGNVEAAQRAQEVGRLLLDRHKPGR
jgi:AcrR family transcriptional regulator